MNWLNKIISNRKAKRVTQTKVRAAYLLKDSKYLRKAYQDGRDYIKIQIVRYMAEVSTQNNFDFLLAELKVVKDERLRSFIYVAIMNIALNEEIKIAPDESEYLDQHFDLLRNITFANYKPSKPKAKPIAFRNKLKDHLEMLEKMKRQNDVGF